jgi:two-component system sensor histidine kinase SenX3
VNAAAAAALAGVAVAVVLLLAWWRSRRAVVRRLELVLARLEEGAVEETHGHGVERTLGRLERAVDHRLLRIDDVAVTAERMAEALEAIPQGVVICDQHSRVVHRNGAAGLYVGARHGEALVEAAIFELLHAALEGAEERRTLELYGPPRRTLVVWAVPLDDGRRTVGAVAIIDDVSERRRLEAMRRDFVANISHELKTPVGALSLLAETIGLEDDPAIIQRLAERMQAESLRVGRTIDDLLELSRIEAEEAPRREPVPVHLAVAEAVDRVGPAAEQRGIAIAVDEPPHRLTVLGDRRQLVSAVYNLLDNAVKYSDSGSAIEVTTTTNGSTVELSVRDHGDGIPLRDLERIFERFYRVDRARSRETGGTGLGLAIVRHVANNHKGEVRVQSREGEGSTFTLRLPAGPGPVAVSKIQEAG